MQPVTTAPNRPPVIIVYGDHKIGKTTFAAGCPAPLFITSEDGAQNLGVQAMEFEPGRTKPKSSDEIFAAIDWLRTQKHGYKTCVIDSADWNEKLYWSELCRENGWSNIAEPDWGKGYTAARALGQRLIAALERLNQERKMIIVIIAHAKIEKFQDPERESYDRYTLDLNEKAGNDLCQFADIIGFAAEKIVVAEVKEGMKKINKAKSVGVRMLYINKKAAFEAGNRYSLPDVELSWDALNAAFKARKAAKEATPPPTNNLKPVADEKRVADADKIPAPEVAKSPETKSAVDTKSNLDGSAAPEVLQKTTKKKSAKERSAEIKEKIQAAKVDADELPTDFNGPVTRDYEDREDVVVQDNGDVVDTNTGEVVDHVSPAIP